MVHAVPEAPALTPYAITRHGSRAPKLSKGNTGPDGFHHPERHQPRRRRRLSGVGCRTTRVQRRRARARGIFSPGTKSAGGSMASVGGCTTRMTMRRRPGGRRGGKAEGVVEIPREETWWRRGEQVLEFLCRMMIACAALMGTACGITKSCHGTRFWHIFLDINLFRVKNYQVTRMHALSQVVKIFDSFAGINYLSKYYNTLDQLCHRTCLPCQIIRQGTLPGTLLPQP